MSIPREAIEAADKLWRAWPQKYTPTLVEDMLTAALPHLLAAKDAEIAALREALAESLPCIYSHRKKIDTDTFEPIRRRARAALEMSGGVTPKRDEDKQD